MGLTLMKLQCCNSGAFHPTYQSGLYFHMCPCVAGWFCGQHNNRNCKTDVQRIPDGGWVSKPQMFAEEEIPHTNPKKPPQHNKGRVFLNVSYCTQTFSATHT